MEAKKSTRKKKFDKQIELLDILENDARRSVKDLAEMLAENEDDIAAQLTEMEKKKVSCGYHTLIAWE